MPSLTVENVPLDVFDRLKKRAIADCRTLPEELLHLLREALEPESAPIPRLPDFVPSEEISAPFDLPRSSQPISITAVHGAKRLPDAMAIEITEQP